MEALIILTDYYAVIFIACYLIVQHISFYIVDGFYKQYFRYYLPLILFSLLLSPGKKIGETVEIDGRLINFGGIEPSLLYTYFRNITFFILILTLNYFLYKILKVLLKLFSAWVSRIKGIR